MKAVSALLFVVGMGCCSGLLAGESSEQEVSFKNDIVPILRLQCASCHMTGSEPGGLKLYPSAAYGSVVGQTSSVGSLKLVEPGQPTESYLLHKLKGTQFDVGGEGARMPQGNPPLAEALIEDIELWIQQGAKNN